MNRVKLFIKTNVRLLKRRYYYRISKSHVNIQHKLDCLECNSRIFFYSSQNIRVLDVDGKTYFFREIYSNNDSKMFFQSRAKDFALCLNNDFSSFFRKTTKFKTDFPESEIEQFFQNLNVSDWSVYKETDRLLSMDGFNLFKSRKVSKKTLTVLNLQKIYHENPELTILWLKYMGNIAGAYRYAHLTHIRGG